MPISREKKEELVRVFSNKLAEAKVVLFTDYRGLKVEDMTDLRKQLREKGVEIKVIKNSLLKIAADNAQVEFDSARLSDHPMAVVFGYDDEVTAAKSVFAFSKDHEALEVVGGFLEGRNIDYQGIKTLSEIPSREELIAKMMGSIKAPVSNFVGVLNANVRSIVLVLNAIKESKA